MLRRRLKALLPDVEKLRGSFPIAERCADEFLSLPMYPELTREQIEAVARELKSQLSTDQIPHASIA